MTGASRSLMSASGTKRTWRRVSYVVRFRGEADMDGGAALTALVVDDPKRSLHGQMSQEADAWLFRDHSSRRGARRLLRRRDHKCDPGIPAVGPILRGEFLVAFDVEVTLRRGGQGNDEPELRAHADQRRRQCACY